MDNKQNIGKIIKIQQHIRGFLQRNENKKVSDGFHMSDLKLLLNQHIVTCQLYDNINSRLKNKKCRKPNFPSEISENIVKFAICKNKKICPNWDTKCGDLTLKNKKIEVKGFSSTGPTSFGPTEKWDMIYFIDCMKFNKCIFKIYEIRLSNSDIIFQSLMMNANETYNDQCKQKRRPRIGFSKLISQLDQKHYSIIFNGHLDDLI